MKHNLIILCVFLAFFSFSFADIYVETSNDSITIWNTNVWEHCALSIEFFIDISNDTITVIEHDTMPCWTTCVCRRNLSVTLTGLESGNYYVQIYRRYSAIFMDNDSLYYIGSTNFNYNPISQLDYSESYYQSGCYYLNTIEGEATIINNLQLVSIYPNPFNSATIVKYQIKGKTNINISIFDIHGKLIDVIKNNMQEPGYYELVWEPLNIPSGLYVFKISSNGKSQTQKALYLK